MAPPRPAAPPPLPSLLPPPPSPPWAVSPLRVLAVTVRLAPASFQTAPPGPALPLTSARRSKVAEPPTASRRARTNPRREPAARTNDGHDDTPPNPAINPAPLLHRGRYGRPRTGRRAAGARAARARSLLSHRPGNQLGPDHPRPATVT